MSDDQIIQAAVTLGGIVAAFASLKNDTAWIKRTLEKHIESDDKRFDKINEKLEG